MVRIAISIDVWISLDLGDIWNVCLFIFYEHQIYQKTSSYCNTMVYNGIANLNLFWVLVSGLGRFAPFKIPCTFNGLHLSGNIDIWYNNCTLLSISLAMAQASMFSEEIVMVLCCILSCSAYLRRVCVSDKAASEFTSTLSLDSCSCFTYRQRSQHMGTN